MKINESRLRREVAALIRIPSHSEVDTIAQYTLERLRDTGADAVHLDEDGNVIGSMGHGDGLLLNAHLDTVGVQGFDGNPYAGHVKVGRLIGRGASDCKAGVATLLEIAHALAGRQLHRRVLFAFTVWEEASAPGPNGAFGTARRVAATDAVIMEPTVGPLSCMNVYAGCRGILRMDLTVRGKACHSSTPELGDNALYRAAELVRRFQKAFASESMPHAEFTLLEKKVRLSCVASLTEILASQGRNIIPDQCKVGMDCRLLPGQDSRQIEQRVKALANEFGSGKVFVEVTSRIPGHVCKKESLINACQTAAERNGFRSSVGIMGGRTDSTIFQNERGIPAVVFGPGDIKEAHTRNEGLHLPSFYSSAQACLDAVLILAGEPSRRQR